MNTRSIYLLAGTTALVAVVAAVTLKGRETAVQATPQGTKLFPELPAAINDVAAIELKSEEGTTTLKRTGDTWGLVEKKGYPVDMASVRKTLIGMSELTTAESKTDDPKQYAKIGVEDPGTEGSTSTGVTLRDASGKELANLVVGKERTSKNFSAPKQVYVRKPGDARAWLANGEVATHEKDVDWLDKKILEVKRDRVRSVEVRHPDGEVLLVDRDQPETANFTLHGIPEGKELSYPTAPGAVASALEWLNFEDVSPAGEVDMSSGTTTAKFACFDGLIVTATTKTEGEKTYARFEATFEEPPAKAEPPAPDSATEKKEEFGETAASDGEKKIEPPKPPTKSSEETREEVEQLNAKLSQWTYVIPAYNKASFQKKTSELVKDKAPPAPETPAEAPHEHVPGEAPHAQPPKAPGADGGTPSTPPTDERAKPNEPESKPPR